MPQMRSLSIRKSRRSFTLIEIAIALFILSLAAGGIGWRVSRLISHHRFQSEAADICLALQEAQFISIIHETECELLIYPVKGKLVYQLKTAEPLAVVNQKPRPLKESKFITLNDAKTPSATFNIRSSGRIEPTGVLGLHQSNPSEAELEGIWLDFQTPVQIKIMQEKPRKISLSLPEKPNLQTNSSQGS